MEYRIHFLQVGTLLGPKIKLNWKRRTWGRNGSLGSRDLRERNVNVMYEYFISLILWIGKSVLPILYISLTTYLLWIWSKWRDWLLLFFFLRLTWVVAAAHCLSAMAVMSQPSCIRRRSMIHQKVIARWHWKWMRNREVYLKLNYKIGLWFHIWCVRSFSWLWNMVDIFSLSIIIIL